MQRWFLKDGAYEEKRKGEEGEGEKEKIRGEGGKKGKKIKRGKKQKVFLRFSSETELLPQDLISKAEFN